MYCARDEVSFRIESFVPAGDAMQYINTQLSTAIVMIGRAATGPAGAGAGVRCLLCGDTRETGATPGEAGERHR